MGQNSQSINQTISYRPLMCVCMAFSFAVFLSVFFFAGWQMLLLFALCLFSGLALLLRRHKLLSGVLLGCALGLMLSWITSYQITNLEQNWAGKTLPLELQALDYQQDTDYGYRLDVSVLTQGALNGEKMVLYTDQSMKDLKPGDLLSGQIKLSSARGRESLWALAAYSRNIRMEGTCHQLTLQRAPTPLHLQPRVWAHGLAERLGVLLSQESAAFLTSVTLGEKQHLSDRLRRDLDRTGLSHITAASGLHVHLIASAFLLLPGSRRRKCLLLIPILPLYGALAGASPSIIRAVVMQELYLTASVLNREEDGLTSLSLALALLLLWDPVAIANVGLQLSFAAMAGILLVGPRLTEWWKSWNLPGRFWYSLQVTISANVFTLPLVLFYFGSTSSITLLSNLLVLWILPVLLPGAIICCFGPLRFLAPLLDAATHGLLTVIRLLGRIPWASFSADHKIFLLWLLICYLLGFAAWKFWLRPGQTLRLSALSLLLLTGCFLSVSGYYSADALTYTALDVGQGQCILLTDGDHTTVVDCGSLDKDCCEILRRELGMAGRGEIDELVITHYDSDHISGFIPLLDTIAVHRIYLPIPAPEEQNTFLLLTAAARAKGSELILVREQAHFLAGKTDYRICVTRSKEERGLALHAARAEGSVLVMGDVDALAERRLLERWDLPRPDILTASHHGSRYSNSFTLLTVLRPRCLVVSAGENNMYGHPHPDVLERCRMLNIPVLRTDRQGRISCQL